MAFGVKTNERPGTRAQVRYSRVSAYKAREVLNLIRGKHVVEADQILQFVERDVALVIRKCLTSAVANATNNDEQDPEALFVSACYADEGPTLKRWRPRARGRATRIRKRTCHITIIVSRMSDLDLRLWNEKQARSDTPTARARRGRASAGGSGDRRARVARSRQRQAAPETTHDHDHDHDHDEVEVDEVEAIETADSAEAEIALQDAEVELAEAGTDDEDGADADDDDPVGEALGDDTNEADVKDEK
jgi:large subunit ribosomal protein L22